jgi:hypothetical protein
VLLTLSEGLLLVGMVAGTGVFDGVGDGEVSLVGGELEIRTMVLDSVMVCEDSIQS